MSEINLDKDLEALLEDSGGDKPAELEAGAPADLGGLADDLGSLVGSGAAEEPAPAKGDDFSLDDEMKSMMQEESAAPAAGGKGVLPASAFAPVSGGGSAVSLADSPNLEFLLDIKLNVTFEVGRAKMLISDLLTLGQGSVIELHRLVGDELDLLVNGRLIAKGEVVVINEKFGCKITSIISPEERVKHMGGM
jgi:flagellar motor switch protein FliN/FliY